MNSSTHPTFKVRLSLRIWTHKESVVQKYLDEIESSTDIILLKEEDEPNCTTLYKELKLPFAPFLGLNLSSN